MDILSLPRPDDDLCHSVRLGNMSGIRHASEEIRRNNSATFSRALTTCVSMKNIAALEFLLGYSEVDDKLAEAAARSESTEIVSVVLHHGWPIDRQLRGGSIPSILRCSQPNGKP